MICSRHNLSCAPQELRGVVALAVLLILPSLAEAIDLGAFSSRRSECVEVAGLRWHTQYENACDEAQCEQKLLLVYFVPQEANDAQRKFERYLAANDDLRTKLNDYVLVRVSEDERVRGIRTGLLRKNRDRIIDDANFAHLGRRAGLAIVDYAHTQAPYYGDVVSVLPFKSGKYYHWTNAQFAAALDLPAGTITQRTMIWAVRTHPEKPKSTVGKFHSGLAELATRHSAYQASIGVQGHQNWESRFHLVVARAHAGTASEVVAESWENQDLVDSAIDCVASWRQSPGHWSAVSARHGYYAYDIRKGHNGIWYGTGIFAN